MKHLRGGLGLQIGEQHRDELRMLVLDERRDNRGVKPFGELDRTGLGGRRDARHEAVRLALAQRHRHQVAYAPGVVVIDQALTLGAIEETADRGGDL